MNSRFRRCAVAGTLAAAMALGVTAPASAQVATESLGTEEVETIGSLVGSLPLGSTFGVLGSLGSSNVPLDGEGSYQPLPKAPRPVDPSITTSEFREVIETDGLYEYWLVTSAAMQREVVVEVARSRVTGQGPAPVLYLLDGVDSREGRSGFFYEDAAEKLQGENVHLVVPTGAYSSYFSNWLAPDPVLGYNKWETFLTEELPGIVESRLTTNGINGIGGVSMGGQAAVHLAATHPELYRGVMSISGYYSTTDELGYQSIRGSVEGRGGDLDNMWGPRGGELWRYHDTIAHPEKLKGTAVYLSTGDARIGDSDRAYYGQDHLSMLLGLLLEKGVVEGTHRFSVALDRADVEHRVDYGHTGLHAWHTFQKTLVPGWNHIKAALQG